MLNRFFQPGNNLKLTPYPPLFFEERGYYKENIKHVIIRKVKREIVSTARELRKNQTKAEEILWKKLRNRKFLNHKFLRQHPISFKIEDSKRFFIADFICYEKKLIIEIDGGIHFRQKEYDQYRDLIIHELGFHVIRVPNKMIEEDIDHFLTQILTPLLFAREGSTNHPPILVDMICLPPEGGWGLS